MNKDVTVMGFQPVSETEMMMVEGDGIASAIAGTVIGAPFSGFIASCHLVVDYFRGEDVTHSKNSVNRIFDAMIEGAIGGAITGAIMPML